MGRHADGGLVVDSRHPIELSQLPVAPEARPGLLVVLRPLLQCCLVGSPSSIWSSGSSEKQYDLEPKLAARLSLLSTSQSKHLIVRSKCRPRSWCSRYSRAVQMTLRALVS